VSIAEPAPATSADARHGGTDGNERLTGSAGATLLLLLAVEGLTVLSLGSLLSLHVSIGVMLIPPVALKIASTGYRFARYYTGSRPYVAKGPPPLLLRVLAPVIVVSAGVLLATGVALLVMGPGGALVRNLHKLSFIALFATLSVHVLAHLRKLPALTAADWRRRTRLPGASARRALVIASLLAGLAFGAVAVSYDGAWVHRAHHHHIGDGGR
jgi:hypothetical protein